MSFPTLAKTWQFTVNGTLAAAASTLIQNQTLMLALKNGLLGFASNAWTVRYSCNSVTAGTAGDGVDRWATITNLVWGTAGSAHSWFVLRQANIGSTYEILISLENSTSSNAVIAQSNVGFTGGTTTARPTATDEYILSSATWTPNVTNVLRTHFMQSTDGQCTRMIVALAGTIVLHWQFDVPSNQATGWVGASYSAVPVSSTTNCCNITGLSNSTTPLQQIRSNGTAYTATLTCEGTNTGGALSVNTATNLANEIDGNWPFLPIGLIGTGAGARGRNGVLFDCWWGATAAGSGNTYPLTGNTFAQIGNMIFPWNGTTVALS